MVAAILYSLLTAGAADQNTPYFAIRVVDEATGRGVPLVQLETVNNIQYFADSNGLVAFHEPGLMDQTVYFHVKSHGYEYPKDGFGNRGVALKITPGGEATVKLKRINVAERLYRITGAGIYRDSVLLGRPVPTSQPVLNGLVFGSDSVNTVEYQGRLYWFYGDTNWPAYPLGNFHATGAASGLPGKGGLDPDVAIDLNYFVRENGFAKEMAPLHGGGPTWLDGLVTLPDETGRERMYAAYAIVNTKMEALERGLVVFDDDRQQFERLVRFELNAPVHPGGHPFKLKVDGVEYIYFVHPQPFKRVRADIRHLRDLTAYEAFTCLMEGTRPEQGQIDRDAAGQVRYAWKKSTPPLSPQEERKLVETGKLKPDEVLLYLRDADTGKPMLAHAGSVYWNDYRRRWVLVVCELFGTSVLGETWYAEADTPLGPWVYARKVVTHEGYSFYNPKQHPIFARDAGRVIYFEGTYTHTFSGSHVQSPRYDYNQVMYKLDLADERLVLPVPVYEVVESGRTRLALGADGVGGRESRAIAFFALDRPRSDSIPVYAADRDGSRLTTEPAPGASGPIKPLFYALPAATANPPATTAPLYTYTHTTTGQHLCAIEPGPAGADYTRSDEPVCLVWRNPTRLRFPTDR